MRDWLFADPKERHRPPHAVDRGLAVFWTASTYQRAPHLGTAARRNAFQSLLGRLCRESDIEIAAWVLLPDHYHVLLAAHGTTGIASTMARVHRYSAHSWNREDGTPGRRCWYQYWDTSLWTEGDLITRINYIHRNPVKHGCTADSLAWQWSSLRDYHRDAGVEAALARFPAPLALPGDEYP